MHRRGDVHRPAWHTRHKSFHLLGCGDGEGCGEEDAYEAAVDSRCPLQSTGLNRWQIYAYDPHKARGIPEAASNPMWNPVVVYGISWGRRYTMDGTGRRSDDTQLMRARLPVDCRVWLIEEVQAIAKVGACLFGRPEEERNLVREATAQFTLESGHGRVSWRNANNCFGRRSHVREYLSGSVWDGKYQAGRRWRNVGWLLRRLLQSFRKYVWRSHCGIIKSACSVRGERKVVSGISGTGMGMTRTIRRWHSFR